MIFLSVDEAAYIAGVDKKTIFRWLKSPVKLNSIMWRGQRLVKADGLMSWLEERQHRRKTDLKAARKRLKKVSKNTIEISA